MWSFVANPTKIFFTNLLLICSVFAVSPPLHSAPVSNGLYGISGRDSRLGEFSGEAQVVDGHVVRKIVFTQFHYAEKKVELIWEGQNTASAISFRLSPSQTLTSLELGPQEFTEWPAGPVNRSELLGEASNIEITIDLQLAPHNQVDAAQILEFKYVDSNLQSEAQEEWRLVSKDPGPEPLWQNKRYQVSATGHSKQFLVRLAEWLGLKKVINAYQAWVAPTPWSLKTEFKENQQWSIFDPTDYEFFQAHPETLRVTNKTINPLSLREALNKLNAYGPKLFAKAARLETETIQYNLNSAGLLEIAHINAEKKKIRSEIEGDAALWTGVFAWSQSLKYKRTHDPESLEVFRKNLKGLITLINITNNSEEFARTLVESKASESALGDRLVQGTGEFADYKWQQGGNNDMIKGLFLAFIAAHSTLSESDPLRAQIAQASKQLLTLKAVKARGFNLGIAWGLNALYSKDAYALKKFNAHLENITTLLADAFDADSGFYHEAIADWSGIHLSTISTLCQLLLSQELESVFLDSTSRYGVQQVRKSAEKRLFEMSETYKLARRDFLTIIAHIYSPAARASLEHQERAKMAIWTLREVPAPRFTGVAVVDHSLRQDWALSRWPSLPWKEIRGPFMMKKQPDFPSRRQGTYIYPIYESVSWDSTYLWKDNPFRIHDASPANKVYFSADYLMLYHVALSGNLIRAED